ncbi:MAG: UPF0280 family protein [Dehalococcoidales bacterium]|nr:MAG: UPF0280 family protein [Dehalococcoidales bacterium]
MSKYLFEPRTYRNQIHGTDLVSFGVTIKETDLYIRARKNLRSKAERLVEKYRTILEKYIERYPDFLATVEPFNPDDNAPLIVKEMVESSAAAGVGPMAAVAGAIAEHVGRELLEYSTEVIVENGGDIFMKSLSPRTISIYAGNSRLSNKIALEISPEDTPLGICTSSGTIGHSLSYGKADAVVIISSSASLADAVATAVGNIVKNESDIQAGLEFSEKVPGVKGALIIINDKMGVHGDIKLNRIG